MLWLSAAQGKHLEAALHCSASLYWNMSLVWSKTYLNDDVTDAPQTVCEQSAAISASVWRILTAGADFTGIGNILLFITISFSLLKVWIQHPEWLDNSGLQLPVVFVLISLLIYWVMNSYFDSAPRHVTLVTKVHVKHIHSILSYVGETIKLSFDSRKSASVWILWIQLWHQHFSLLLQRFDPDVIVWQLWCSKAYTRKLWAADQSIKAWMWM